jgi:hypothetical protein
MSEPENEPADRLARLLSDAGFNTMSGDGGRFAIPFNGATRDWWVMAHATALWINLRTAICDVPAEGVLRNELFAFVLERNAFVSLAKFITVNEKLMIELDYRSLHVDAEVIGSLVRLLYDVAEESYPAIFRIVWGDHTLQSLEESMKRTES